MTSKDFYHIGTAFIQCISDVVLLSSTLISAFCAMVIQIVFVGVTQVVAIVIPKILSTMARLNIKYNTSLSFPDPWRMVTTAATVRCVNGCLLLVCCQLVTHAPFSHPLVQTASDWQLKMSLFILMMESFVSAFLVVALERLRQTHMEAGDKRALSVMFCGLVHQLIAVATVLPCIRAILQYSHAHPLLPMYSYISHISIPILVSTVELTLCFGCVLYYLHTMNKSRDAAYDEEDVQLIKHSSSSETPQKSCTAAAHEYVQLQV